MDEKFLTILCIKTNKGCFISKDYKNTKGHNYTPLSDFFFDGKKPADTYASEWYYIEQYPTSVQKEQPGKPINIRYELIDESLASDKMPKVIPYEEENNYNSNVIGSLYSYKYDMAPNYLADIDYDIQVICEIDNYNFPPKMSYNAVEKVGWNEKQYTISNADVHHQMLDRIIFPAVLLHDSPCKFTSKQMYDMTRQYIIDHIDNSVAKISSNYDFCFAVDKLIPLPTPETITYHNIFARTKRERNKVHTTIKKYNEKNIFEMTHDQSRYNNYSVIPEMCANNEAELKEKVDTWLEGLMEIINEPLCQCPHCQGSGYVGEVKKQGFDYKETHL